MPYGFSIKADENVVATMKRVETSMRSMSATVGKSTKDAERNMEDLGATAQKVGRYIAEAFAIREVIQFGREILDLTAEFEGFSNVIKFSSKNSFDAGQNLEFIGDIVKKLHLPMKEAMQGFSEMQAGLIGTGVEGNNLRKVFEGIATAGAVLHLPAKNLEMILYDFKEIGERGLNMRNWMSLSGWMPGIGNIVHETFGKNFHELETEKKIAPGEFLTKLAEGMTKHFSGGVPNAGNSLVAQMNDTKNAMTSTLLTIGENLRPVFVQIMKDIQGAFDIAPVKLFIENIKPIVETLMTIGKAWLAYKAGVLGTELALKGYAKVMEVIEALQAMQIAQIDMLELAMVRLEGVSAGAWVGALLIGLGYIVEKFIDVNNEAQQFIDKLTGMGDVAAGWQSMQKKSASNNLAFTNLAGLTKDEKSELLSSLLGQQKSQMDEINMRTAPSLAGAKMQMAGMFSRPVKTDTESPVEYSTRLEQYYKDTNQIKDNIGKMTTTLDLERKTLDTTTQQIKTLQKQGVTPYKQLMPNPESGIKNGALHTMGLAGAKGGLGDAKVITIHIGTMQRVDVKTPGAIKTAAQDGMEVLLRALNNLAYGRSVTM